MVFWEIAALALSVAVTGAPKMDPNLSLGTCTGGGTPIILGSQAYERTYTGSLVGEDVAAEVAGMYCAGYLPTEAQFCLTVPAGGGTYDFEVTEAEGIDTVLAITGGPPELCDDDGGNSLLSRLTTWLEAGQYQLYVGSYSHGVQARFTLRVASTTW